MDIGSVPKLNMNASMDGINLTPEDAFVLSRINGTSTVAEIQKIVGFTEEKIMKLFDRLVEYKLVEFEVKETKEQVVKIDKKITNTIQKKIREKFEVVEKGDHYKILNIEKGAPPEVVEKAYFEMSKEFHPDRFFNESLGPFKQMLEEVFSGIQESYRILSDPDLKRQYFQEQRKRKVAAKPVKKDVPEDPAVRRLKNMEADLSSANAQFEMGLKEEEKGNLKAALNFFKMAIMFDEENKEYMKAYARVKDALKNPLHSLSD